MARALLTALLSLALWPAVTGFAQTPEPSQQPPTIIPEERGAPVPAPDGEGITPVRPVLEPPVKQYNFTEVDRIDPGEINAESLIGQPVVGPDGQSLGIVDDIMLHAGEATSLLVRPAGDNGTEPRLVAIDQVRVAPDGRSLAVTSQAAIGAEGMPVMTDIDRVGRILNSDIASRDGALTGQIHDLIMDERFRVKDVVVRLPALQGDGDVFASIPYLLVERRPGTEIYLFDDRLRERLVEFRYARAQ